MQYFVIEGNKIGISKLWTRGAIWFFLTIVVLGYITTVYLLGKVIIFLIQNMYVCTSPHIKGNVTFYLSIISRLGMFMHLWKI